MRTRPTIAVEWRKARCATRFIRREHKGERVGFKADIEEVTKAWGAARWRFRIFLILTLFMASGTVASLSETVAKWKGFFLDAVRFYQQYISIPIGKLLSQLVSMQLPIGVADALVLLALMMSANMRILFYRGGGRRARVSAFSMLTTPILFIALLIVWRGQRLTSTDILVCLCGTLGYAIMRYWQIAGATRLIWFTSMLAPVMVVGLAAAVNAGLSK